MAKELYKSMVATVYKSLLILLPHVDDDGPTSNLFTFNFGVTVSHEAILLHINSEPDVDTSHNPLITLSRHAMVNSLFNLIELEGNDEPSRMQ